MDSFPQFSRSNCPPEVQDIIWTLAIQDVQRRIIELEHREFRKSRRYHERTPCLSAPAPIPALLHACRRSRALAMKRWTLTFKINDERCNAPKVWFDFTGDFLVFLGSNTFAVGNLDFYTSANHVHFDDRARLQNIAVYMNDVLVLAEDEPDVDDWELDPVGFDGVETAKQIHAIYPNLTTLYIVLSHAPEGKKYEFAKPTEMYDHEGYGPLLNDLTSTWLNEEWGVLDIQYVDIKEVSTM